LKSQEKITNSKERSKKMPQVIDMCQDSDEDGEWPTTASIPSLPLSRKRLRDDKEVSSSGIHLLRNENGPGKKKVTGSAEFFVDLELADEVEELPHTERRCALSRSDPSVRNDATGNFAQVPKGVEATAKDVAVKTQDKQAQTMGLQPATKYSQKLSTSKPPNASAHWRVVWEARLSELADYRKSHGHCNVPYSSRENPKLATWVANLRYQYKLHLKGKPSQMTFPRIQELESLGFEWDRSGSAWKDRLSELADYRKSHGHCNVPRYYSKNRKLSTWVATQRKRYKLHLEGKPSKITLPRIQELESLGFELEWVGNRSAWEDRLSDLADYCKCHGHCDVSRRYGSENYKLGRWVAHQRKQYRDYVKGNKSYMTLSRIQALESLCSEWESRKRKPEKPSPDYDATRPRERTVGAPEYTKHQSLETASVVEGSAAIKSTSLSKQNIPSGLEMSPSTSSCVEPQNITLAETGDAQLDETDLDGLNSELAAKPSPYSARQVPKSLTDDSVESNTRKDALQVKHSWPVRKQTSVNSVYYAILAAGPDSLVAAKEPANSTQLAEFLLKAEPPRQRQNFFTHALLLGDGPAGNGVQTTPDEPANAPPDMQQTPRAEDFQSDNLLNEVEMELIWLGEESMYCLVCPEFQFDFIYEYASPALKVELRKITQYDESETEKLRQIVRMDDRRVSRHFDFTRKDIRMNYF
jgi:hypothetical protein